MSRINRIRQWSDRIEYPAGGMLIVTVLLMVSPWISNLIPYVAFVLCLYRMIRYNVKVFMVDYCILIPYTYLFRTTGGMSLVIWLCLFAAVWYFIQGKIRANGTLIFLLLLLNYLLTRMQMNINDFVLCFGQIFIFYVLLPAQDAQSAKQGVSAFCWSMIISSVYALLVRDTSAIISILGNESEAIWGSGIMRFRGLFEDPNYYMTLVIVGLALLCKLKESNRLHPVAFWIQGGALATFGILTYSKAFYLVFVALAGTYIIWQFWSKKLFRGVLLTALTMVVALYFLSSENSPVAVVLERLTSSKDLSEFTTNRSELFLNYWNAITENIITFFFGHGLNAPLLNGWGAHNLYLEIAYYSGMVGLVLLAGFCISMINQINRQTAGIQRQNVFAKYVVLLMVGGVYCSLQGMFLPPCYGVFFLALLSMYITKNE